ncbi:hypothetical protein M3Y94_01084300 [Aphelenchoides besseyi]|nr:hypothetical protein M3Y94_01084300 [Aphelenchoides besseyi]
MKNDRRPSMLKPFVPSRFLSSSSELNLTVEAPKPVEAEVLSDGLDAAEHPGEWRSSSSTEKGSFWDQQTFKRNLNINQATASVEMRTTWMAVNGIDHSTSLLDLSTDVEDVDLYTRRADNPPCSRECLQMVFKWLPRGRYAVCPNHKRVIRHPLPPIRSELACDTEDEKIVTCKLVNCVSPIYFTVKRFSDAILGHKLRSALKSRYNRIISFPIGHPVEGGYACCLYLKELQRCKVDMIGAKMVQVELVDLGENAILEHGNLFELPTNLVEMAPVLAFRCSLFGQDTRLLDFKYVEQFKQTVLDVEMLRLEPGEYDVNHQRHFVTMIDPTPPILPENSMAGRGTRNRQRQPPPEVAKEESDEDVKTAEEAETHLMAVNMDELEEFMSCLAIESKNDADQ